MYTTTNVVKVAKSLNRITGQTSQFGWTYVYKNIVEYFVYYLVPKTKLAHSINLIIYYYYHKFC